MKGKGIFYLASLCTLLLLAILWRGVDPNSAVTPVVPNLADSYAERMHQLLSYHGADLEDGESGPAREALRAMKIWSPRLHQDGSVSAAAAAINEYNCAYTYEPSQYVPNWTCLGPTGKPSGNAATGNGQVHRVVFDPQYDAVQNHTVYCISHFGGLWRSTTEKVAWSNVNTDVQLPFCTVADLAIDPKHSDTLFIATGDGDFGRILGKGLPSIIGGISIGPTQTSGVYRSFDGGDQWTRLSGVENSFCNAFVRGGNMRCIRVNPKNSNQVFVATTSGIYKSSNALDKSSEIIWELVLQVDGDTEWRGIEFHPENPDIIYASGADVYRSQDGGNNWSSMTQGIHSGMDLNNMPFPILQPRINITTTPADPDRLYAHIYGLDIETTCEECKERCPQIKKCKDSRCKLARLWTGVYVWKDNQWYNIRKQVSCSHVRGQQRRWLGIAANPTNPNNVYCGQTVVFGTPLDCTWEQLIKGNAFSDISGYNSTGIHADVHDVTFEPLGVARDEPWLWATTHGGVSRLKLSEKADSKYKTKKLWQRVDKGLQVGTIWDFDQSSLYPDQIILALQDNGVIIQRPDSTWRSILGGDGYAAMFNAVNNDAFIRNNSSIYRFKYSDKGIGKFKESSFIPDDPIDGFRTAIRFFEGANHPITDEFYTVFGELYARKKHRPKKGDKPDEVWAIKSDIGKSVGMAWKRMILSFEIAEADPEMMYVLSTGVDGIPPATWKSEPGLFYTTHGGCDTPEEYGDKESDLSCFQRAPMPPLEPDHPGDTRYPLMKALAVNPADPYEVFVVFSGYDPRFKVWSWKYNPASGQGIWNNEDPTGSLNNLPVNQIVYQKGTEGRLYIGTDAGVWIRDEGKTSWERYGEFPNVRVLELKANYCSQSLLAATFGRGVWEGDFLPMSSEYPTSREIAMGDTIIWENDRPAFRPIHIKDGGYLKINSCSLHMPADSWIQVDAGGTLILKDAVITNSCGKKWQGIFMMNNKAHAKRLQKMPLLLRDKTSHILNADQTLHYLFK